MQVQIPTLRMSHKIILWQSKQCIGIGNPALDAKLFRKPNSTKLGPFILIPSGPFNLVVKIVTTINILLTKQLINYHSDLLCWLPSSSFILRMTTSHVVFVRTRLEYKSDLVSSHRRRWKRSDFFVTNPLVL